MKSLNIPKPLHRFLLMHYELIRDFVLANEQIKQEMAQRSPHVKLLPQYPVMSLESYQEGKFRLEVV